MHKLKNFVKEHENNLSKLFPLLDKRQEINQKKIINLKAEIHENHSYKQLYIELSNK